MARVYIVTEEEMQSLIEQLELTKLREKEHGAWSNKTPETQDALDLLHRTFHHQVVRWAQAMGFQGWRR